MYETTITIIIGLIAGLSGAMLGLSGAFIIVPLLLFFGICQSQLMAQGTTLFMLLPPLSIFAVYAYYQNNNIDYNVSLLLMVSYVVGTIIGSNIVVTMKEKDIQLYFATMLLVLSMYMFSKCDTI